MKTFMPTHEDKEKLREWVHIDAQGKTLGRLASTIANVLKGKNKPTYTPHADCGDFVIVTNADKIVVTGQKLTKKVYSSHSGYPGGFKQTTMEHLLNKHPERVLEKAVKGMLPHNRLGRSLYRKLFVYTTATHPHSAQQPKTLEISAQGELVHGK